MAPQESVPEETPTKPSATNPPQSDGHFRPKRWPRKLGSLIPLGVALLVVVLILIGFFGQELPAGPADGTHLNGSASSLNLAERRTIRVGTFNIHGARGLDGVRDLDRIASQIENLDFIGLNEVHGVSLVKPHQAEYLGRKLQMPWLFVPTERCWLGEHFGSAVLSRLPLTHWHRIPLVRRGGNGYRNVLLYRMPFKDQHINFLTTHVDRTGDRERQLAAVISLFLAIQPPVVLMGDLNSLPDDPEILRLLAIPGVVNCLAAGSPTPVPDQIDWIFTRGLECNAAGFKETDASDHPSLWAELVLPK